HDRRVGRGGAGAGRQRLSGETGNRRRRGPGGLGPVDLRVLVADPISQAGLALLLQQVGIQVDVCPGLTTAELVDCIGQYDGLIVRSATRVTAEVIAAASRLRVIGRAGVGVDNIDVDAATRKGIVVINAPEGNTIATAEHTIAMMFALAR